MTLYRVTDQRTVEPVKVIKEELLDGASENTYLVRYRDGTVASISKDYYHKTPKEAWAELLRELRTGVHHAQKQLRETIANIERYMGWYIQANRDMVRETGK